MQRWEYRQVSGLEIEDKLNSLGREGWELVQVISVPPLIEGGEPLLYAFLKRPLAAS